MVNSFGVVSAVAAGTANISYTLTGCYPAPVAITVNSIPVAITGTFAVCENAATTALADASSGGTWTSSNTAKATVDASGVVTGVSFGSTTINYSLNGCIASASVAVGGNASTLTGASSVCGGSQIVLGTNKTGGVWSSSNPTIAQISGTTVTGIASGTATITYVTPGCAAVTKSVTVNFVAPITGTYLVCMTDSNLLADATAGGLWTSSNTALCTVNSAGMIYGVNAGTDTVVYTAVGGCSVNQQIVVNACGHKAAPELTPNDVQKQAYTLFPNPGNGKITITQGMAVDGMMQISVMDYVGKILYTGNIEFRGGAGQLNISAAPGMYLVLLQDHNGAGQNFKVVIE
jgi:uncharacterized protein YjdB